MQASIRHQVSPYLVFFIVYNSQVGVGILSFQRTIAEKAGYDAWIGVLVSGCIVQLFIWMTFKLLEKANGDIVDVHHCIFGKLSGNFFSFIIMFYYWLASLSVILAFIRIIQLWMFPTMPSWVLSTLILILVYYCVSGGFRIVAGVSFISFIFPQIILIVLYIFPLKIAHFSNLLPVMDHSFRDLADSIKSSMYTLAGTETLLMYYPFIRDPKVSKKFAHLGVLFTTLLYTLSSIVSFTFYSEDQLKTTIWPELSLTKIIKLSYLERFEYLYISLYLLIVTALLSLLLWCSSRGLKRIFNIKQKYTLLCIILLSIIISHFSNDLIIELLDKYVIQMNLWLFYGYIPILLIIFSFLKRGKQNG
ncbi:GerAB/ArcD/ProY family transporter [Bacillus salipaludis]|uniref:GerAB/ArcD/ProY family transporter n=1 Tax=Bacillus salipaludis TaxID=2547811 RepID=UPI002E1A303B|nr:GerAB/ArcD/ProY family transporter [Bacillus salipaludis]